MRCVPLTLFSCRPPYLMRDAIRGHQRSSRGSHLLVIPDEGRHQGGHPWPSKATWQDETFTLGHQASAIHAIRPCTQSDHSRNQTIHASVIHAIGHSRNQTIHARFLTQSAIHAIRPFTLGFSRNQAIHARFLTQSAIHAIRPFTLGRSRIRPFTHRRTRVQRWSGSDDKSASCASPAPLQAHIAPRAPVRSSC